MGAAGAAAAADCEYLGEAEFRSLVLDAQAAIDRGNLVLPGEILQEIEARVPCMTFAPAPRMWADVLVARAIIQYRAAPRSREWRDSLYAATRIRPLVDRGVSSVHPIAAWDPLSDPDWNPPEAPPLTVPPDREIYVDGMRDQAVPSGSLTLVQRTDGTWWNSVLVDSDETLSSGWLLERVEQPPRVTFWARTGAVLGVASTVQNPRWTTDVWVEQSRTRPAVGLVGDVHLTFYSPFGVWLQGGLAAANQSPGYSGRLMGVWQARGVTGGVGVGTASADTFETGQAVDDGEPAATTGGVGNTVDPAPSTGGVLDRPDPVHQVQLLQYPVIGGMLRTPGPTSLDAGLSLGFGPSMSRADADLGVTFPSSAPQRVRLALAMSTHSARFTPQGLPNRLLTSSSTRALLRFDLVWGEDY